MARIQTGYSQDMAISSEERGKSMGEATVNAQGEVLAEAWDLAETGWKG